MLSSLFSSGKKREREREEKSSVSFSHSCFSLSPSPSLSLFSIFLKVNSVLSLCVPFIRCVILFLSSHRTTRSLETLPKALTPHTQVLFRVWYPMSVNCHTKKQKTLLVSLSLSLFLFLSFFPHTHQTGELLQWGLIEYNSAPLSSSSSSSSPPSLSRSVSSSSLFVHMHKYSLQDMMLLYIQVSFVSFRVFLCLFVILTPVLPHSKK